MTSHTMATGANPDVERTIAALQSRHFATISTVSPAGRPHAAGVMYDAVGTAMYFGTLRTSRKARNIAANPHVGMCIIVRRLPIGPPSLIHFQGTAELLDADSTEIRDLVAEGKVPTITGHGELDLEDGCFVKITPGRRLHTYGLGMSLWQLFRNPLGASGSVELD